MAAAAKKLELLVVVDPFFSASAALADVVLPAATFAESPTVDSAGRQVSRALIEPQHQAWPDWKIIFELARAVGLSRYFPWQSFEEAMKAPRVPFMADAALQPRPQVRAGAVVRFGTPTGGVEFASTLLEARGLPPLPEWTPPTENISAEFPLRLVTGPRTQAYINSQFHGIPTVEAKAREPLLLLHPQAATAAGVRDGQRVDVVSPHGRVRLCAQVTLDVHPGAAVMPAGWASANANELIDPRLRDAISGFPAFRSGICRVEPVAEI